MRFLSPAPLELNGLLYSSFFLCHNEINKNKESMKKTKIIFLIIAALLLIFLLMLVITGRARTDVYLKDYILSEDGKIMTLNVDVASSSGYIRKMKRTSGSMNYYLTFYSTFGINSKIGSKDKFEITLDENADEIYFYNGDGGYKLVLCKDENDNWIRAEDVVENTPRINEIEGVSMKIKDGTLTSTGATIIITDTTGEENIYGSEYRIDKKENGKWKNAEILIEGNYGWTLMGYHVDENDTLEMDVNWEWLYGKLEPGTYRIVKGTSKQGELENKYFSVEFEIK